MPADRFFETDLSVRERSFSFETSNLGVEKTGGLTKNRPRRLSQTRPSITLMALLRFYSSRLYLHTCKGANDLIFMKIFVTLIFKLVKNTNIWHGWPPAPLVLRII